MLLLFTILLVLGIGNDPISAPYQDAANPFQLTEQFLVRPERFELPTAGFEDQNSIQLSYGRNIW